MMDGSDGIIELEYGKVDFPQHCYDADQLKDELNSGMAYSCCIGVRDNPSRLTAILTFTTCEPPQKWVDRIVRSHVPYDIRMRLFAKAHPREAWALDNLRDSGIQAEIVRAIKRDETPSRYLKYLWDMATSLEQFGIPH